MVTPSEAPVNVCRFSPPAFVHRAAFDELVETTCWGAEALGHPVAVLENAIGERGLNILIGANLLTESQAKALPSDTVVYNLEQMDEKSEWLKGPLPEVLGRCIVWDYSARNLDRIRKLTGNDRLFHVPVGYSPGLTRIAPAPDQDVDVLFYGSVNDRRREAMEALRSAGLKVHAVFGVYGRERDALIARAKVVLNLHYYESSVFEIVRVFYLLANRKAVVAECHEGTDVDPEIRSAVRAVPYDGLTTACLQLVQDPGSRKELEETAFRQISGRPSARFLQPALEAAFRGSPRTIPAPTGCPRKLNLGSGKDWRADCLNVDISPRVEPDAVLDFSISLPFGREIQTRRFGTFRLERNAFDLIVANDVLEHMPNLVAAMTSSLQLLRVGGEMHIMVPYDLSCGAWQDPTHVRAFNEKSWLYYTDWFWYLGWEEARFDLAEQTLVLSEYGKKLASEGTTVEVLVRTPRAVDTLAVKLRKRLLSPAEKGLLARHLAQRRAHPISL